MSMDYITLDPKIEYIKIFGLQRSGTNYISHLLDENFVDVKSLVNVGGWKHGHYAVPYIVGRELHVIVIVKNPYSWLVSMYEYWGVNRAANIGPDLRGVSFENFVKNKVLFEKQRDVPFLLRCENPVQHWNNMNFHWLSIRMNEKKLSVITYETLLTDLEPMMKKIQDCLGLKFKGELTYSDKILLPASEKAVKSENNFEKKNYYLQNEFLKYYNKNTLDFVNSQLDLELMVHLGYDVIGDIE